MARSTVAGKRPFASQTSPSASGASTPPRPQVHPCPSKTLLRGRRPARHPRRTLCAARPRCMPP
eukprot:7464672-Pyramimonas_sp.AAC.1